MGTVAQSPDMQSARLKEVFWATVFGAGEEQLSALLAELKSWGMELESIILSRAAVAEQAQAGPCPAQQHQQRRSMPNIEHSAGAASPSGKPAVRFIRHEAFQGQAPEPDWNLASAPARRHQQQTSRDVAVSALPQNAARQEPVQSGAENKPCKCKKSRCLKLYCDCFATGHFCNEACFCMDCQNRTSSAPIVFRMRTYVLSRDSTAFQPKVAGSAAHVRGCHCRKSRCLKKYCECFLGNVPCTDACRCVNCQNKEPRAQAEGGSAEEVRLDMPLEMDLVTLEESAVAAPRKQQHLDQDFFLADPAIDSSASLEGASVKQSGSVSGASGMSGAPSEDDSMDESDPMARMREPGRNAAVRSQPAPGWVAGQASGSTSASLDDPSMADDATSPPPCVPQRGHPSRSARAPIDPQRSINPTLAGAWQPGPAGAPARDEAVAQLQTGKRRRLGMRLHNSGPSPQPVPDKHLACTALQRTTGFMPAAWRPVLMEVLGSPGSMHVLEPAVCTATPPAHLRSQEGKNSSNKAEQRRRRRRCKGSIAHDLLALDRPSTMGTKLKWRTPKRLH